MAAKLRKGDKVIVISGKDKSKTGEVTRVIPKDGKALVTGVNSVIRHTKQTQTDQGGRITKEMPIDIRVNKRNDLIFGILEVNRLVNELINFSA